MTGFTEPEIAWSQDQMIEVTLNEPDDFLKVRETLTRIGVAVSYTHLTLPTKRIV